MPAGERRQLMRNAAALLRERADSMAMTLTLEQGKILSQAKGEIMVTAAYFDELADCGARISGRLLPDEAGGVRRRILHEPIGPVFAVSPVEFARDDAGPKNRHIAGGGLFNHRQTCKGDAPDRLSDCCVLPGRRHSRRRGQCCFRPIQPWSSDTLIAADTIRKVSFTGSTEIGKMLAATAGSHMKKVTMELGGHAPVIIFDDIDISNTVASIAPARYHNAGQSCMAATRFFVQKTIYDEFVSAFSAAAKAIRIGDGVDAGSDMGPLTSERRVPVMSRLVDDAVAKGAVITAGGKQPDRPGYFFEPTVLADVADSAEIMTDEPFGPVSPLTSFDTTDDVIRRANSTPYGLASYVFTRDQSRADRVAEALDAGLVGVNTTNIAGPVVPFGGVRDSGIGREGAMEGILESMTTKTVSSAC